MAKIIKESKIFNLYDMYIIFRERNFDNLLDFIKENGINAVDRSGRNILINCVIEGNQEWAKYIITNFEDLDLNSRDYAGRSALHYAFQKNYIDIVTDLLNNKNVDINIVDNSGDTALMSALEYRCNEMIVIKLLEAGLDINKENNYGKRPNEYLLTKINDYIKNNNIKLKFRSEE